MVGSTAAVAVNAAGVSSVNTRSLQPKQQRPLQHAQRRAAVVCRCEDSEQARPNAARAAAAAVLSAVLAVGSPALADLNKFEANTRGEFGIGSAAQYGSADLRHPDNIMQLAATRVDDSVAAAVYDDSYQAQPVQVAAAAAFMLLVWYIGNFLVPRLVFGKTVLRKDNKDDDGTQDLQKSKHANENFRRANFTSADIREADFSGSTFNGAYFEKAVAFRTNFEGADLTDTLMDRMVLNEANLKNALLVRAVLTRSDLADANIENADFSDAILDLPMKNALCKYASGINPVTNMDTRKSLGCGNRRKNAYGSPSAPELSAPPQKILDKNGFCDDRTGLCKSSEYGN
eukprot:jgi/Chlat1/9153/Chrsp97S08397